MKYLSPLSRRSFMKMFAAGAGAAALAPLSRLARAQETITNTSNRLLVVFAQGGLRSADFCDAYNESTEGVDTHYNFSDCIDVNGDGSWMLGYINDLAAG